MNSRYLGGVAVVAMLALGGLAACSSDSEEKGAAGAAGSAGVGGEAGTAGTAGNANGGSAGAQVGGSGGSGGAQPPTKVDKIDLLLMIDNSASMSDKQDVLAKAVPDLVQRPRQSRVHRRPGQCGRKPACQASRPVSHWQPSRQSPPVFDIHVGVVSSSLGGHGADTCAPGPSGALQPPPGRHGAPRIAHRSEPGPECRNLAEQGLPELGPHRGRNPSG